MIHRQLTVILPLGLPAISSFLSMLVLFHFRDLFFSDMTLELLRIVWERSKEICS